MAEKLHLTGQAQRDVEAYAEYRRIVGDDDGGKLFSPKEYEEYKKKVIPMRIKNRLYVSWSNPNGMDCILVGPETECFCQHRFKQHKTDFDSIPTARPIHLPCEVKGCPCKSYSVMVKNCGQPVMCHCKHRATEHSVAPPYLCKKRECMKCSGFRTSFSCECGTPAHQHEMRVETGEEREARGHPVGMPVPYKAMGGLTGFSSLAAGYERLDPSGIGAPSYETLNAEITGSDHPFLRANVHAIKNHKLEKGDIQGAIQDSEERQSQMRREGESEMDFYERRYKERQKRGQRSLNQPVPQRAVPEPRKPAVRGARK